MKWLLVVLFLNGADKPYQHVYEMDDEIHCNKALAMGKWPPFGVVAFCRTDAESTPTLEGRP